MDNTCVFSLDYLSLYNTLKMETYIPHSLIIEVKPAAFNVIISTKEGDYKTDQHYTHDANGITGQFTKIN